MGGKKSTASFSSGTESTTSSPAPTVGGGSKSTTASPAPTVGGKRSTASLSSGAKSTTPASHSRVEATTYLRRIIGSSRGKSYLYTSAGS